MSPVPQDLHGAARLVAAVGDLQPPLPATSLGVAAPLRQQLGTIDSGRRRCLAIARLIDRATLGWTLAARSHSAGSDALAGHRLERRDLSHHPCLGLERDPPYSAHR